MNSRQLSPEDDMAEHRDEDDDPMSVIMDAAIDLAAASLYVPEKTVTLSMSITTPSGVQQVIVLVTRDPGVLEDLARLAGHRKLTVETRDVDPGVER